MLLEVKVPQTNVNDLEYCVVEIFIKSGAYVNKGQILCALESSKAAFDIIAEKDGYFYHKLELNKWNSVGDVLGQISDEKIDSIVCEEEKNSMLEELNKKHILSKRAEELIKKHHIDLTIFGQKKFIKEEDVISAITKRNKKSIKFEENSIIIIGGGGHSKICIDIIKLLKSYQIEGIVDSILQIGSEILGIQVISNEDSDLNEYYKCGLRNVVLAIGSVTKHIYRAEKYQTVKALGFSMPNIIHPSAVIEESVCMGDGNQIFANAVIGSDVRIGENCIINAGSIISHDCTIGNNVHIAPGAIIAGGVNIGSNTLVGMGCTIYLGVSIGENVIIKNGLNIFEDIPSNTFKRE